MSKKSKVLVSVSISVKETNWDEYNKWEEENINKKDSYDGSKQQAQDDYGREEFEAIKNNH